MNRLPARPIIAIVAVVLVAVIIASTSGGTSAAQRSVPPGPPGPKPTIVPAEALTPAPTPPDSRRVAILTLDVASNADGKLEAVKLAKGLIIHSYAPNVFGREGAWTVSLLTREQKQLSFGIVDPRRVEFFDSSNEKQSVGTALLPDVTFDLVVPLNDPTGADLGVATITITDQHGQQVFTTPVLESEWSQSK
jgi:hypothetical protein